MTHFMRIFCGMILAALCLGATEYPVQGTFLNFYRSLTPEQWSQEFQDMKDVSISTVVVVSVGHLRSDAADPLGFSIAPEGLLYPSAYLCPAERPDADRLEMILALADRYEMQVLVGSLQTQAKWTNGTEFAALRAYNRRIALEILQRYGWHTSLQGWYFTQEIWINWVKYYGHRYYGVTLLADWASDLKSLDATKVTAASVVVKKEARGVMPGLTALELQRQTTSLLKATSLGVLMPQDGIGAQAAHRHFVIWPATTGQWLQECKPPGQRQPYGTRSKHLQPCPASTASNIHRLIFPGSDSKSAPSVLSSPAILVGFLETICLRGPLIIQRKQTHLTGGTSNGCLQTGPTWRLCRSRAAEDIAMIDSMATIRMTDSEVTKDFTAVLKKIGTGIEVIVEQNHRPVALISPPKRTGRLISDCIASAKASGSTVTLDEGFMKDVEEGIANRSQPWNPPSWE